MKTLRGIFFFQSARQSDKRPLGTSQEDERGRPRRRRGHHFFTGHQAGSPSGASVMPLPPPDIHILHTGAARRQSPSAVRSSQASLPAAGQTFESISGIHAGTCAEQTQHAVRFAGRTIRTRQTRPETPSICFHTSIVQPTNCNGLLSDPSNHKWKQPLLPQFIIPYRSHKDRAPGFRCREIHAHGISS